MDDLLSDQPDREHGNPLKPDRTRIYVGKKPWPIRSSPGFGISFDKVSRNHYRIILYNLLLILAALGRAFH